MMFDPWAVRRSFDQAAAHYEAHDWLQWEVAQRLMEQPQLVDFRPQRIVDAGCGTGRLTAELKQRWPKAQVIGVDWAPTMVAMTRRRSRWRRGLDVACADLANLPLAPASVDLLVCNLALQWCNDVPAVLNSWRRVLRPGGLLLFATFGPATLHELRAAWAMVDQRPHVSPFPELQQVGDWLQSSGFRDPVMAGEQLIATYPDTLALMRELKGLGAHNGDTRRARGLTGRRAWQAMNEAYRQFFRDERAPATWEIFYGAAWGPQEGQPLRTPQGDVATFSLAALRRTRQQKP